MNKCVIIVEGIADAVFINDLIFEILPRTENKFEKIELFKKGKKIQINDSNDINILVAGGCTSIRKYNKQIVGFNDDGFKVIMIQDADSLEKDNHHGGVTKRLAYLEEIKEECEIEFETFLFPNCSDDGTLETMLLSIATENLYQDFYDCYAGYSKCTKNINEANSAELLDAKYLIYNYCQVYQGSKRSNEKDRTYTNEFWELNDTILNPIKDFLIKEIDIN